MAAKSGKCYVGQMKKASIPNNGSSNGQMTMKGQPGANKHHLGRGHQWGFVYVGLPCRHACEGLS